MTTTQPQPTFKKLGTVLAERYRELQRRQRNPEAYRPIATGLRDLDAIITGFPLPSYIAIAGPEKGAKTATMQHLMSMMSNAERGSSCIFSIEEMLFQWADRFFASLTTVERGKIRDLKLTEEDFAEFKAIYKVMKNQDLALTSEVLTAEGIIKESVAKGFRIIGVDGVQLLMDFPRMLEKERLERISRMFLDARNKYGLTIITTWQLNEEGKVHGSRQSGKDADLNLKLSPVMDLQDKPVPGRVALNITSSRISAANDKDIELKFSGAHSRIGNLGTFDVKHGIVALEDEDPKRISADPSYIQEEL